jgi:hypothetical protein
LYVITRILFGALVRKASSSLRVAVGDRLGGVVAAGGSLVGGGVGARHAASVARTRTRGGKVEWFMLTVGLFYSSGSAQSCGFNRLGPLPSSTLSERPTKDEEDTRSPGRLRTGITTACNEAVVEGAGK